MKMLLVIIATIAATQLSPAFATERDVIERAQAAFDAQLALDCVPNSQIDWVAEDAVYQYALSGIDMSLRMVGRAVIAEHLCALSAVAPGRSRGKHALFSDLASGHGLRAVRPGSHRRYR